MTRIRPFLTSFVLAGILVMTIVFSSANARISVAQTEQQQSKKFSIWKDPEGRFSLEYPTDWKAKGKSNRFEHIELELFPPESSEVKAGISIDILDERKQQTQTLNELCEEAQREVPPLFPNYELEELLNYTKYKIDMHETCSFVFTYGSMYYDKAAGMEILSLINSTPLEIGYTTTTDKFDTILPTVERTISSIRILNL